MTIKIKQNVWNPNFKDDMIRYLSPALSKDDLDSVLKHIKNTTPTTFEKLETLIDRIEFICHLTLVKAQAKSKKYYFQGEEIIGINWDIDALQLYLALTCIDIFATNFEQFDKWLSKNCADFDPSENFKEYIEQKSDEYRTSFQLSSNFSLAFSKASKELQKTICENIAVKQGDKSKRDIETIASYFYRIRNKYTHEGRRFHSSSIPIKRAQAIGPRDKDLLEIEPSFDLTETILLVAKEQANRIIKVYAEQYFPKDC